MAKKGGFRQKWCDICNMNYRLPLLVLFSLVLVSNAVYSQGLQFDPDSLRDDGPIVPMILNPLIEGYTPQIEYSGENETGKKYNGFRVQVLSTKNVHQAENIRRKLASEVNYNIRVIFEAPTYKVRLGGFTNRYDAEKAQKHISRLGYTRAWIVRAHIIK